MSKILDDIKFGLLTDYELFFLIEKAGREKEKRNVKPEEYIDVVYADDGSEGFYCLKDNFHKIPSDQLHAHISETLSNGSSVTFSLEKYDKTEYAQNGARYEWKLSDGSNTEVEDDFDEEDDESDINNFKEK